MKLGQDDRVELLDVFEVFDEDSFQDIHVDGLVHISEVSDRFVKNPAEVVKVQQKVTVTVLGVDLARRRISLSLKNKPPRPEGSAAKTDA